MDELARPPVENAGVDVPAIVKIRPKNPLTTFRARTEMFSRVVDDRVDYHDVGLLRAVIGNIRRRDRLLLGLRRDDCFGRLGRRGRLRDYILALI